MTVSINGSGGITYPDGSVNTTRSVSTAGDTMTGVLNLPQLGLSGDLVLTRTDTDNSVVLGTNANTANRNVVFQKAGGGAINGNWSFRGRVTNPEQPAFQAQYNIGTPTAYVAGSRILNFTSVQFNVGNCYDGTNKFTAPVAGRYWFSCDRALNTSGPEQQIRHPSMAFQVNGSSVYAVNTAVSSSGVLTSGEYAHFNVTMTTVLNLNAGDYVQVIFNYTNTPSTLYEYSTNYFNGYFLG